MTHTHTSSGYIPMEEPQCTLTGRRSITIGLPATADMAERRFPLTPEAAAILVDKGVRVVMQQGAAEPIHYTDAQYSRVGVVIGTRAQALACDMVIHLARLTLADMERLRRGALWLTLGKSAPEDALGLKRVLERGVTLLALDLVEDNAGHTPFADILAEIDGRAAVAIASSLLADGQRGKGILLGGVAGVVPCEVTVVGSGISARAAALSAMGLGAMVRMFDNDVYRLRHACRELGPWVTASSLHPKVFEGALRSADVVIVTPTQKPVAIGSEQVQMLKRGVVAVDLSSGNGDAFPSLPKVNLGEASALDGATLAAGRVCYVNAGCAVARTAAMAMGNTLLTFMENVMECESATGLLQMLPGMQKGAMTFMGKVVNQHLARRAGLRCVDISIYLTLS